MSLEVDSLRALAHPTRLRMLSLLTGAQLSATEVAAELGISQANASYHLRQLLAVGELVVAEERSIRGGVAKIYRYPHENPPRTTTDAAGHRIQAQVLADELLRRSAQRLPGHPGTLTDADLWVDPDVWAEILAGVGELSQRLHAAARPPRTAGTIRTSTTMSMFQMRVDQGPGA
jgi:DNA-binding transcriptional ArsR family regulator